MNKTPLPLRLIALMGAAALLFTSCAAESATTPDVSLATDVPTTAPSTPAPNTPAADAPAPETPAADAPAPETPAADAPAPNTLPDDQIILRWEQIGGCAMMIDASSCGQWTITAEGAVTGIVPGGRGQQFRDQSFGSVDPALVAAWLQAIANTDLAATLVNVGPGPCRMAADGIDMKATAPTIGLTTTSCEANLFADEPGLVELVALGEAAEAAAPLQSLQPASAEVELPPIVDPSEADQTLDQSMIEELIIGEWFNDEGTTYGRSKGPVRRFRQSVSFAADGSGTYMVLHATDAHYAVSGTWVLTAPDEITFTPSEEVGGLTDNSAVIKILSANPGRLELEVPRLYGPPPSRD